MPVPVENVNNNQEPETLLLAGRSLVGKDCLNKFMRNDKLALKLAFKNRPIFQDAFKECSGGCKLWAGYP